MKALAFIALLFGLAAAGASVYAKVESYPNWKTFSEQLEREGPSTPYDADVVADYAKAVDLEHYAAWAGGALAVLLGAVALSKQKGALPVLAIVTGLAGIGLSLLTLK